jgi:Apea-like HEPN
MGQHFRKKKMKIYVPLRGPDFDELYPEYDRFLEDFDQLENTDLIKSQLDNYEEKYQAIDKINFKIIYSSKFSKEEDKLIKSIARKHKFFHTEFVEDFLAIEVIFKNEEREKDEFAGITADFLLSKLALLINITYATKIDILNGVVYSNQDKYLDKTDIIISSLDFAYEIQLKTKWPKIVGLKLDETLNWYVTNNLHTDLNSKNRLHRAINSLSYQFSNLSEKDTSILFWTMVGIEALLADGSANIITQIKTKTSIILGEPKEYKKKLDKLYNYRSRFVHGDINFPAKFSSDYDSFEDEYYNYLHFSTSILIALIRTLIVQNKSEFVFEYRLK